MNTKSNRSFLMTVGFQSFLWTQFLGALNDNLFKYIVAFLSISLVGKPTNMSLTGAIFILPFLLFSGYAGQLADAYSKRTVLIVTKSLEIVAMALALYGFWMHDVLLSLVVLFLMALQSTLFSPAKYGILPEMLPEKHLSDANGWLEMTTFLAIILGSALSGAMFELWRNQLPVIGSIFLAIAIVGTVCSFGISRVPPSGAQNKFQINPWKEIGVGLRRLYSVRPLWRTVMGISYFWFLGSFIQMLLYTIAIDDLQVGETGMGYLLMFLSIGIGSGSLLAGRLSGDRVELGWIPIGSIGMGVFSLILVVSTHSYFSTSILLILIGLSGGFFIVPLNAYLQKASGVDEKGRLIAANNFINMLGVLIAAALNWLFLVFMNLSSGQTILILGILTLGVTVYIARLLPYAVVRILTSALTHSIFKIKIIGNENIPKTGAALLVSNHISYADGFLVGACVPRYMRFLVYKDIFQMRGIHWLLGWLDAIPVSSQNQRDIIHMLRQARGSLQAGDAICIFAEGAISRTGNLLPFQRGFEKIVEGTDTPIIPVHLDGLWGSIFSYEHGRFFWKWPKRFRCPVIISFGKPMPARSITYAVRQQILEMSCDASFYRKSKSDVLSAGFIKQAKRSWFSFCMADSTGQSLTYGRALTAGLLLARWIRKNSPHQKMIGLMLPASVGGALANLGVTLSCKTAVNLNFTAGCASLESAIRQCNLQTIITSPHLLTRMNIEKRPEMIFLEDILPSIPQWRTILTLILAFILPSGFLRRIVCRDRQRPDDLAAILFSSGSTGEPKGVMLSHYNIIANLDAVTQILGTWENNRFFGILPFFHSFGLTGTLWLPIMKGYGVIYHPNPMEARRIGELCIQHQPGVLLATPTFFKALIRKCEPESFASFHHIVTGAERLTESAAREFHEKFGVTLLEGYGCTEMSPVVAVNTLDFEGEIIRQIGHKPGTVGHPLPGVAVRIVHPDSGESLPVNTEGLLLVRGANQMMGYWQKPELTAQVIQQGWYNTGDIARVDENGFITITDRLSRFSKIGGEMVPHIKVEEAIESILTEGSCAVASVPDENKGERLVVLITSPVVRVNEIWNQLKENGMPALWIPKPEDFFPVPEIPVLGTGKRDLSRIQSLARELSHKKSASPSNM